MDKLTPGQALWIIGNLPKSPPDGVMRSAWFEARKAAVIALQEIVMKQKTAVSVQQSDLDDFLCHDSDCKVYYGNVCNCGYDAAEAELARLRTERDALRAALWETTTRYHALQKHDGVFDACQHTRCKLNAALLSADTAGQAEEEIK